MQVEARIFGIIRVLLFCESHITDYMPNLVILEPPCATLVIKPSLQVCADGAQTAATRYAISDSKFDSQKRRRLVKTRWDDEAYRLPLHTRESARIARVEVSE